MLFHSYGIVQLVKVRKEKPIGRSFMWLDKCDWLGDYICWLSTLIA